MADRIPFKDLLGKYGFEESKKKNDVFEYRKQPNDNVFLKIDGPNARIYVNDIAKNLSLDIYEIAIRFIWYHELTEDERKILPVEQNPHERNLWDTIFESRDGCLGKEYPAIFEKYDAIVEKTCIFH